MKQHTASEVQEADRLWDLMKLKKVAKKTGIPYPTLRTWSSKGWISTQINHQKGPREYGWDKVKRADKLYDLMSLPRVSEIVDVPERTLYSWKERGWISTDKDWRSLCRQEKTASPKRAARLVYDKGLSQKEAANHLGVHQSTISRYLKEYRESNKTKYKPQ